MTHDRNEVCVMKIEAIEEKISAINSTLSVVSKKSFENSQAIIDLLPRVDQGHRKVDAMNVVVASIDKSLATLIAVTEEKRLDRERLRKQVDNLEALLKPLAAMVQSHGEYIKEQKESKTFLIGLIATPIVAALVGWIAGHK